MMNAAPMMTRFRRSLRPARAGVVALLAVWPCGCRSSLELRIANGTGLPLTAIDVEYGWPRSGENTIWRIDSLGGADTTQYRVVAEATPVPRVRVTSNGRAMEARPQDLLGERPLRRGRYTYILRLAGSDDLIVVVERER